MSLTYTLKRTGEINHPEPLQPAYLEEITWLFGRMIRTSDPGDTRRFYGLSKTGSEGALACRKAIDPYGIEGFDNVEENSGC